MMVIGWDEEEEFYFSIFQCQMNFFPYIDITIILKMKK